MKRRIDVNLEELDQIIDRGRRAPLSESEGEKLRTAIHAMADRLVRKRNTEKTSAVLPDATGKPEASESAPAGHGGARGPRRLPVLIKLQSHTPLSIPATFAQSAAGEKCMASKEPATLVRFVGHARAIGSNGIPDGATA